MFFLLRRRSVCMYQYVLVFRASLLISVQFLLYEDVRWKFPNYQPFKVQCVVQS